jgi:endonuclease YncB( thermonuclease family)
VNTVYLSGVAQGLGGAWGGYSSRDEYKQQIEQQSQAARQVGYWSQRESEETINNKLLLLEEEL